jgi:hypothetical protein
MCSGSMCAGVPTALAHYARLPGHALPSVILLGPKQLMRHLPR